MARIGLFGGSFDPVHVAHLILAECARDQGALEKVLFVPARQAPNKPDVPLAPAGERLRMLQLAVAQNPYFEVSTVELDREEPSYTLLTVRQLKEALGRDCRLCLVVGTDSILDMPHWWHAEELIREVEVLALERPGFPLRDLRRFRSCFGAEAEARIRKSVVKAPLLEVSATEIRQRLRQGRSIRYLVPERVRDYILAHGVYLL